jgi:hypothetical protein
MKLTGLNESFDSATHHVAKNTSVRWDSGFTFPVSSGKTSFVPSSLGEKHHHHRLSHKDRRQLTPLILVSFCHIPSSPPHSITLLATHSQKNTYITYTHTRIIITMEPRWHKRMVLSSSPNNHDCVMSVMGDEIMIGGTTLSRTPSSRLMGATTTTRTSTSTSSWNSSNGHENCPWQEAITPSSYPQHFSDSLLSLRSVVPPQEGGDGNGWKLATTVDASHQMMGSSSHSSSSSSNSIPTAAVLTQSTQAVQELLATISERCHQQQAYLDELSSSSTSLSPDSCSNSIFTASPSLRPPSPSSSPSIIPAPEHECHLLAQWAATDTHYRVVIAALGGIPKLVTAMRLFANDAGLQTACCTAIEHICQRNGSNQLAVVQAGGIPVLVQSMRLFPQSITVQSAAIQALRCLHAVIMYHVLPTNKIMAMELVWLLQHAKKMYITTSSRESLEYLLTQLRWS